MRRLRLEHGVSQARLAEVLDVSQSAVTHYESGDYNPSSRVADVLGSVIADWTAPTPTPDGKEGSGLRGAAA